MIKKTQNIDPFVNSYDFYQNNLNETESTPPGGMQTRRKWYQKIVINTDSAADRHINIRANATMFHMTYI